MRRLEFLKGLLVTPAAMVITKDEKPNVVIRDEETGAITINNCGSVSIVNSSIEGSRVGVAINTEKQEPND